MANHKLDKQIIEALQARNGKEISMADLADSMGHQYVVVTKEATKEFKEAMWRLTDANVVDFTGEWKIVLTKPSEK